MPRPHKCRRICALPNTGAFGPVTLSPEKVAATPPRILHMTLDEYETIRLIDLLGYTQEACAAQMGVARTTVQAVYTRARQKMAQALVDGDTLVISGGDYELCPHAADCRRQGCSHRRCRRRCLTHDTSTQDEALSPSQFQEVHHNENCRHV